MQPYHSAKHHDNKSTTKIRKRRVVKNAYVDIASVEIDPGENYCDWIEITKQKLKEREQKQTASVIKTIELIVNNTMKLSNFVFPQKITSETLNELFAKMDAWKGVNTARLKTQMTCYRQYFGVAKSWYIHIKRKLYGDLFWAPVFAHIHKVFHNNQAMELRVVQALFSGKIQYSNTKLVALINGGTIIHSHALHQYLAKLHKLLQVKQWIKEQEECRNWTKKAEAICMQIQTQLEVIMEHNVDMLPTIKIKKESIASPMKILGFQPHLMLPKFDNNHNHNNNNYAAIHEASYKVADLRPSPLYARCPKLKNDT